MGAGTVPLDTATAAFVAERRQLLGTAHRVLGRAGDAEDVVQDAWLRWQRCDRSAVENPGAFLTTTTTRLAINVTQAARTRHETSLPRLVPEPVAIGDDPTLRTERVEALERAIGVVLETLAPAERAAFVLRDAFDYSYDRIARVVGSTEVNARQLVSRARRRLRHEGRQGSDPHQRRRFLDAFLAAAEHGALHHLETVLRDDVARSRPPAPVLRLDPVERRAGRGRAVAAREGEQIEGLGA